MAAEKMHEAQGFYLKNEYVQLPNTCPCCKQDAENYIASIALPHSRFILPWLICRSVIKLRGFVGGALLGLNERWGAQYCKKTAWQLKILDYVSFGVLFFGVVFGIIVSENDWWGYLLLIGGPVLAVVIEYIRWKKMGVEFYVRRDWRSKQKKLRVRAASDTWLKQFIELNREIVSFEASKA